MVNVVAGPLKGIRVVDFTTLAPGPLASLILAQTGAEVIKIERPGVGDEMRIYEQAFKDNGYTFSLLNAGKRSVVADLKNPEGLEKVRQLILESDVLLEQFRPGVMQKYGLDYQSLSEEHPGLVYCSITGFGQTGPKSNIAAHDLNYVADSGMLSLTGSEQDGPGIPLLLAADLAAGTYPAVMNILLAIIQRQATGKGVYIDVSMTDNLFPLMFWGLGLGWGSGKWPQYGNHLLTGLSPRYQIYKTKDSRFLAVAALEERFWSEFCDAIGIDKSELNEHNDMSGACRKIAETILEKSADEWKDIFKGRDTCTVVVQTLEEAVKDEHYLTRGLFSKQVAMENDELVPSLPLPVVDELQEKPDKPFKTPKLGEHTESFQ